MRALAIFVFLISVATAQLPDVVTSADHFNIAGIVTDAATAKPLVRAQVTLQGSGPAAEARSASTDTSGGYAFNNVPTGVYQLSGTRAGYSSGDGGSQKTILVSGTQPTHFDLALQPQAVLTGTITDSANGPVVKAQVFILRTAVAAGHRQFIAREETRTDDHGAFRIVGLSPGPCYVAVAARPPAETKDVGQKDAGQKTAVKEVATAFPVTYYPNTTDPTTSQVIDLRPGAEQQADIKIASIPAFRVTGRVSPVTGEVILSLLPPTGAPVKLQPAINQTFDIKSGAFTLNGIPQGNYIIAAATKDRYGRDISAYRQIALQDNNMSGVSLNFANRPSISGSLHVEGDEHPSQVLSAVTLQSGADVYRQSAHNGSFAMPQNVPPGSYQLHVELASNWYLSAATQNGRDVIRGLVTVADDGASQPLLLTANPKGATIEGTVTWPDTGNRIPAHVIVLQPNGGEMLLVSDTKVPAPNEPAVVRPVLIGFLPPGEYVLYAWTDPVNVEYANPDSLRTYEEFVQTLTIGEGQLVRAALKLAIP